MTGIIARQAKGVSSPNGPIDLTVAGNIDDAERLYNVLQDTRDQILAYSCDRAWYTAVEPDPAPTKAARRRRKTADFPIPHRDRHPPVPSIFRHARASLSP